MGAVIKILKPVLAGGDTGIWLNHREGRHYHKMCNELEKRFGEYVVWREHLKVIPCKEILWQQGIELKHSKPVTEYAWNEKQIQRIFEKHVKIDGTGVQIYRECQEVFREGLIFVLAW